MPTLRISSHFHTLAVAGSAQAHYVNPSVTSTSRHPIRVFLGELVAMFAMGLDSIVDPAIASVLQRCGRVEMTRTHTAWVVTLEVIYFFAIGNVSNKHLVALAMSQLLAAIHMEYAISLRRFSASPNPTDRTNPSVVNTAYLSHESLFNSH